MVTVVVRHLSSPEKFKSKCSVGRTHFHFGNFRVSFELDQRVRCVPQCRKGLWFAMPRRIPFDLNNAADKFHQVAHLTRAKSIISCIEHRVGRCVFERDRTNCGRHIDDDLRDIRSG
jgi:hypothetical protein